MVDSQAVKNTCLASLQSKGFCFYKATHGIKRHLAVDSLGFPLFTHCTKAKILLDKGYHPERIRKELEKFYPEIRDKLQFELSAKPSKEGSPR
ncbi:MAG: hypothetical protein PHP00_00825 [Thiotrichaceae bacterium]|nr:hypothetical protein [Thiotrichaceae bacterium]